jgi:hypothetical protein
MSVVTDVVRRQVDAVDVYVARLGCGQLMFKTFASQEPQSTSIRIPAMMKRLGTGRAWPHSQFDGQNVFTIQNAG